MYYLKKFRKLIVYIIIGCIVSISVFFVRKKEQSVIVNKKNNTYSNTISLKSKARSLNETIIPEAKKDDKSISTAREDTRDYLEIIKVRRSIEQPTIDDLTGMININNRYINSARVVGTSDVIYCEASFYDYYSDSQVGRGSTPLAITDAEADGRHGHFNRRILELMKYGNTSVNPAKYPLYLGNFFANSSGADYDKIYYKDYPALNSTSNIWFGANRGVYGYAVTQGLVDDELYYDENGVSYLMTSNPANRKSAKCVLFDKDVLTRNKIKRTGTSLALADVKEEVNFPFRKTTRDGVIYYEFDSRYDVARFNRNGQLDYYTGDIDPYIAYDRHDGVSFLPYNKPSDPHKAVNYCFGMKLEIPFYMTEDGKIDGKDLEFRFSGDDDVWIFVDGELVLDLGGCHRRIYGVINFSEQTGLVEAVCNPRVVFSNRVITIPSGATHYTDARAGVYNEPVAYYNVEKDFSESLKAKFEDSTKLHTITIFYMERAKGASNLEISYNLLAQDSTRIVDGEYHLFELH